MSRGFQPAITIKEAIDNIDANKFLLPAIQRKFVWSTEQIELLVLANMESYNAILIEQGLKQSERIQLINTLAIKQLETIENIGSESIKRINEKE